MKSTKIRYIFEYPKFLKELKKVKNLAFFFPSYHFGGGEKVHLDILKSLPDIEHTTFIIHNSDNDFFKDEFEKSTHLFPFFSYRSKKYKSYLKAIANHFNNFSSATVFGCNNIYFYQIIPYLKPHVNVIDLTHAFSYEDPHAPEIISLTSISHINKRIILGEKTLNDYKNLYKSHQISPTELRKLKIIRNGVEVPEKLGKKPENEKLKILFVSRNSHEKRPEIFWEIAKACMKQKVNVEFFVVGDFDKGISHPSNLKIIGSIKDREKLKCLYKESDVLLITSFREGMPMVTLESMAYGVVNISTPVGELPFTIGVGKKNGIVVNDNTIPHYIQTEHEYVKNEKWIPNHFLENISVEENELIQSFVFEIQNLSKNRKLLKEMSEKSHLYVKNNFSMELFKKNYRELILGTKSGDISPKPSN